MKDSPECLIYTQNIIFLIMGIIHYAMHALTVLISNLSTATQAYIFVTGFAKESSTCIKFNDFNKSLFLDMLKVMDLKFTKLRALAYYKKK